MRRTSRGANTLLILLNLGFVAFAEPARQPGQLAKEDVERIIARAKEGFWAKAVGLDGRPFQPANEQERLTLLIPEADAKRIVNDAVPYGTASWCMTDWRPVYLQYMQVERRRGWAERQIAFVGVLFGLTQRTINGSMGRPCTSEEKRLSNNWLHLENERLQSLLEGK
jgi:hypothetical protein